MLAPASSAGNAALVNITGNLVGTTTDSSVYAPLGTVNFTSAQGTNAAAARARGDVGRHGGRPGGLHRQLRVRHDQPGEQHVPGARARRLEHHGRVCRRAEVPDGATLNLNGLHLYVRGEEIGSLATIFNGTVTLVPGGGPMTKNTAVPADMTNVGEEDDWTFFGFAGETVTIAVDPGDSGVLAAPSPQLGWVTVNLLDQYGDVLATVTNASASIGSSVAITDFTFAADGTYTIQVEAPPQTQSPTPTQTQSDSTGFYEMESLRRHARSQSPRPGPTGKRHGRWPLRRRRVDILRHRRRAGAARHRGRRRRHRLQPDRPRQL